VQFFEEHKAAPPAPKEIPKLPENTFSNFSPFAEPAAVNVLLLDSLNTQMSNQSYVHKEAMNFLKSSKPGQRMAIFTMGLGLHFIQGFNDDPTVLVSALENKKNNPVESSVLLKGGLETDTQQRLVGMMSEGISTPGGTFTSANPEAIAALSNFMSENDQSQQIDRMWLTMQNLQQLAKFLEGFPGRKNIIWFAEKVPALYVSGTTTMTAADVNGGTPPTTTAILASGSPAMGEQVRRTLAMLAAARAAIYPVEPSGVKSYSLFDAETNLAHSATQASQLIGPTTVGSASGGPAAGNGGFANAMAGEALNRNADQFNAQYLAEQSGGRAFANTNNLAHIMGEITAESGAFYTISYSPTNARMDGSYRTIKIKLSNPAYKLSYRRGYFALGDALPGGALETREEQLRRIQEKNPGQVDPLLPYMSLGMPQAQQLLYKAKVYQTPAGSDAEKGKTHYTVEFALDRNDLKFLTDPNGLHNDQIFVSLLAYDRYGNVVARKDHRIQLNVKADVWQIFDQAGVQFHGEISVPQKGNYWLRTGVYDQASHKVGTMEISLSAVQDAQASTKPH
jgi:VWFA-related protein